MRNKGTMMPIAATTCKAVNQIPKPIVERFTLMRPAPPKQSKLVIFNTKPFSVPDSRVRTHNQKMTVAAIYIADWNV